MWPAEAVQNRELKTKRTTKCTRLEPYVSLILWRFFPGKLWKFPCQKWWTWRMPIGKTCRFKKHLPNGQLRRTQHRKRCFLAFRCGWTSPPSWAKHFLESSPNFSGWKWLRNLWNHLVAATTVDGSEIRRSPIEGMVIYPIIYKALYSPGGCLGFLNHQQ